MPHNFLESIFGAKQISNKKFIAGAGPGVKIFDLHNKHLLYGRVDKDGDAIYLDDYSSLAVLGSGRTGDHMALDFVCEAFNDLSTNIKSAANKGYVSLNSLFPTNMLAYRSQTNGDLPYAYNLYLNKMYTTFVDNYLSIDRRKEKIKNYKDFVDSFLMFFLKTASNFPVTRTGFVTSNHCSPFVTGLMFEIAPEQHGLATSSRVDDYINDNNFTFFVNECKKFGFMVDKNAPWRLVFNVASGEKQFQESGKAQGGRLYMEKFAMNFENIFHTYFKKAYLDELTNLKNQIYTFYESFYSQFSTYQELQYPEYWVKTELTDRCAPVHLKTERIPREPPPVENFDDEYWLKLLLKIRLAETKTKYSLEKLDLLTKNIVKYKRLFGTETSLKYINDLTRGLHVTNFINEGAFWYGISNEEYEQRKKEALKNILEPNRVQYSLTGNKNFK